MAAEEGHRGGTEGKQGVSIHWHFFELVTAAAGQTPTCGAGGTGLLKISRCTWSSFLRERSLRRHRREVISHREYPGLSLY